MCFWQNCSLFSEFLVGKDSSASVNNQHVDLCCYLFLPLRLQLPLKQGLFSIIFDVWESSPQRARSKSTVPCWFMQLPVSCYYRTSRWDITLSAQANADFALPVVVWFEQPWDQLNGRGHSSVPVNLNCFCASSDLWTLTLVSLLETSTEWTAMLTLAYFNLAHFNNAVRTGVVCLTWHIAVVFIEKIL